MGASAALIATSEPPPMRLTSRHGAAPPVRGFTVADHADGAAIRFETPCTLRAFSGRRRA